MSAFVNGFNASYKFKGNPYKHITVNPDVFGIKILMQILLSLTGKDKLAIICSMKRFGTFDITPPQSKPMMITYIIACITMSLVMIYHLDSFTLSFCFRMN